MDQIPLPRPADFRAPNWSWAAVDGAISYTQANGYDRSDDGVRLLLELASLRTEPQGLDDFEPLSMAALLANRENLLPMTYRTSAPYSDQTSTDDHQWVIIGLTVNFYTLFDCSNEDKEDFFLLLSLRTDQTPFTIEGMILKKTGLKGGQY